jgi:hypothetical protein
LAGNGEPERAARFYFEPATLISHTAARKELPHEHHDWTRVQADLDAHGCRALAALYQYGGRFRSHVVMVRHGLGRGEYKYFVYPLPGLIGELRYRAGRVPLRPPPHDGHHLP